MPQVCHRRTISGCFRCPKPQVNSHACHLGASERAREPRRSPASTVQNGKRVTETADFHRHRQRWQSTLGRKRYTRVLRLVLCIRKWQGPGVETTVQWAQKEVLLRAHYMAEPLEATNVRLMMMMMMMMMLVVVVVVVVVMVMVMVMVMVVVMVMLVMMVMMVMLVMIIIIITIIIIIIIILDPRSTIHNPW